MAIASILVGILVGMTSFMASLLLGEGLLAAMGYYVLGGFTAMLTLIVLGMIRMMGAGGMQARRSALVLRG